MGSAVAEGTATLNRFFPGWIFSRNIVIGGQSSTYPSGNYYPSTLNGVGFVDPAGNYRLSSSSPYVERGNRRRRHRREHPGDQQRGRHVRTRFRTQKSEAQKSEVSR